MRDEAAVVRVGTCSEPKRHLERGERAGDPEPRFGEDDRHGGRMQEPERQAVHPGPMKGVARDDQRHAEHHERGDGHVQHEHEVGKQGGRRGIHQRVRTARAVISIG